MEMSYEEYLEIKQKRVELSKAVDFLLEGSADIPLVGNIIKATASRASEIYYQKSDISNAVSTPEGTNHFIVLADDYYTEISLKLFEILELKKVKETYKYTMSSIRLKLIENLNEETWRVENASIRIDFLDNQYYNANLEINQYGSIMIEFKESFKQINFNDNKVYIAFEILSIGMNNKFNDSDRDYIEFAKIICYLLSRKF